MTEPQSDPSTRPALIAAHQAIEAATELLRFHREGAATDWGAFGEIEVVEKLAEALALACHIRLEHDELMDSDRDSERKALTDLRDTYCIVEWAE